MANDVRPVDANELLKQAIYCKEEDGSGVYAGYLVDRMPPRRVDVCPCCGAKLEPQKGGVRYELPRVSGAEN